MAVLHILFLWGLPSDPIGFGMALAMNRPAMEADAAMDENQKQAILNKAHSACSEKEMQQIISSIAAR